MTDPKEGAPYRGRFAPTPSGPLHLGSLMTALASYLEARCQGGQWLLRVDDLDEVRCEPGATGQILRQLEAHGLCWDEAPRFQSQHVEEYRVALRRLADSGRTFACSCTRAELARSCPAGPDGPVYPGTCRGAFGPRGRHAIRLRVPDGTLCFDDAGQGRQCRDLQREVGDFTLQRADGLIGYQLACAVDEHAQAITEVVRGADLLGSTFRQLLVQQELGLSQARYRHLPVLVQRDGRKLSKQNRAEPLQAQHAPRNLLQALRLLQQRPPRDLDGAPVARILDWATTHWRAVQIPGVPALTVE